MHRASTKAAATLNGEGVLSFAGFVGEVDYTIQAGRIPRRPGMSGVRGSFETEPKTAHEAFRAGEGRLRLEDGKDCRIIMLAYSDGSRTAYFETVS